MSDDDAPPGNPRIVLKDTPETRRFMETAARSRRQIEQWPAWKRGGSDEESRAALRDFRARWSAFMEGGWEALCAAEPAAVEAARRRAFALIPVHPDCIAVSELLVRVVDVERLAKDEHLFAALLEMGRHGHAVLAAGWAYRPPPRVPRRGNSLEDMFLLFGYEIAREPSGDGG